MNEKKGILKEVMLHRQRVSLKMSTVANDIAANGRRHDNSYTGDVEYKLLEKIAREEDADNKHHYEKLLESIHTKANDYYPDFNGGIECMNMIQLLEYIADRIARIDAREERPTTIKEYQDEVITSLGTVSYDLEGVIRNTVDYFIDRNKSILTSLSKQIAFDTAQNVYTTDTNNFDTNNLTESAFKSDSNTSTGGLNYGA